MSNLDLSTLNNEQLEAVKSNAKELLIMAGAGTGKTKTLTSRITHYIDTNKAEASEIMAICFTNKAANELKERVRKSLGTVANSVLISTHHSVCFRLLRQVCHMIGFTQNFSIYNSDDCLKIVKALLKEERLDKDIGAKPKDVLSIISNQKNALVTPTQFKEICDKNAKVQRVEEVASIIYPKYHARLKENDAMDFDDALYYTAHILEYFRDIRLFFFNKYKHIFVDEYQDTNPAQYKIIRLLHLPPDHEESNNTDNTNRLDFEETNVENTDFTKPNNTSNTLTVVGDTDQSIYAFRGASVRNIQDFEKDFPNAETIYLNTNYRSTQEILDLANEVISKNHSEPKNLKSNNSFGNLPQIFCYTRDYLEIANIVQKVKLKIEQGVNPEEIAIFYRMNSLSGPIEQKLIEERVPYKIIGGHKFFDRREIKDVLAYLTIIINPNDNLSLLRIINNPKRNIGQTLQDQLLTISLNKGISIWEYITSEEIMFELPTPYKKLLEFISLIQNLKNFVQRDTNIVPILEKILEDTAYLSTLKKEDEAKDEDRAGNIYQLLNFAKKFDEDEEKELTGTKELDIAQIQGFNLSNFLQTVSLYTDVENEENGAKDPSVTLMTLHSSKGLEFDHVYITNLDDNILPVSMCHESENEVKEERRLLYVGITRAKKELECSFSRTRYAFGQIKEGIPSRFIKPLNEKYFNFSKPLINYVDSGLPSRNFKNYQGQGWKNKTGELSNKISYTGSKTYNTGTNDPFTIVQSNVTATKKSFPNSVSINTLKSVRDQKVIEVGTTVSHNAFGIGKVENKQKLKKSTILFIKFSSGTKQVVQEFANLEILD